MHYTNPHILYYIYYIGGSDFGSSTGSQWDTPGFGIDPTMKAPTPDASSSGTGSSWKFW